MIRFAPQYVPVRWGDRRFARELGRALPDGPIGESWELVEWGERHSLAVNEPIAGQRLGDLWRRGALGGSARGRFPFLLKWLSVADWLSVQVHPAPEACARLGHGEPKTEAWFVARAEPGASFLLGHRAGLDPDTLRRAAVDGSLPEWLHRVTPAVGEIYLVPAGTLHSLGPGLLLLEVQQPSDSTFRLYDWGRHGLDGRPRALHLDDASVAIDYARAEVLRPERQAVRGPGFCLSSVAADAVLEPVGLRVLVASGQGSTLTSTLGRIDLGPGDVVVAEPADGPVQITRGPCVLLTEP